jgi:hypothetical protein
LGFLFSALLYSALFCFALSVIRRHYDFVITSKRTNWGQYYPRFARFELFGEPYLIFGVSASLMRSIMCSPRFCAQESDKSYVRFYKNVRTNPGKHTDKFRKTYVCFEKFVRTI